MIFAAWLSPLFPQFGTILRNYVFDRTSRQWYSDIPNRKFTDPSFLIHVPQTGVMCFPVYIGAYQWGIEAPHLKPYL
ncbi:hypothetical protein RHMOL_Rhmol05G0237200 [Rhododendron molle]|uniref:Uncharacterized protein n=1 Tax=Rhododendron molle TaxID=49168 RepID=A0ACC0NUP7_RHOML|nr:hypothetical protein RHMOL_Rhmol05G0237200 [Rhododendron molle]